MRKQLGNVALVVASFLVCVGFAELATRIIDGLPVAGEMPQQLGSLGVDTTGGHLDKIARAPGVERGWYSADPPPLPNRTKPPAEWMELDRILRERPTMADTGTAFLPWDLFKAWNSAFAGDPCKHPYLKAAPGRLWLYDPPDGKQRPFFRFLPDATVPDGLVTNAYGWRGPPVPFAKAARTIRIVFVGASTTAEIHHYPYSGAEFVHHWLNMWSTARGLNVRFEVMNAGRESVNSNDIAAIVHQEVAPMRPDLVFYYEGGNQLDLSTVVASVPKGVPAPGGVLARWLREAAKYSALARRGETLTVGSEWPKPDYEIKWPVGLSETDPDLARPDLPVSLNNIMGNLDAIRADLDKIGGLLAIGSFHWLAKDGLVLNAAQQKPILDTLNVAYFPYRYRDLERLTAFENRVFAKYAATHGLPFVDVAGQMPYDPNLFSDGIHNTPAGVRLRAWIVLQQLVPVIEKKLSAGEWPQPVASMGDSHPAFRVPPREVRLNCKAS